MKRETFAEAVSATEPDWSREEIRKFWDPGRKLLRAVRRLQVQRRGLSGWIATRYWRFNHLWWSVITQSEIHPSAEIGGGLLLIHPSGIIIHPRARIGPNCLIFHHVTIGGEGVVIGGHVDIGAGAIILGPVNIGDHVKIGANATVTKDVETNSVARGLRASHYRME